MNHTPSELERVRQRHEEALNRLNAATSDVQKALEDWNSRAIPSPDGDLALRKALRAETDARCQYLSVAMAVHEFLMCGKTPTEW